VPISSDDYRWMSFALQLAERGRYTTKPNPNVGCVIVRDNHLLGEGWHRQSGAAHAEVDAIEAANAGGAINLNGATVYVTLEPCHHQGKTGPCSQALIKAGIARVVFAMQDPNPLVSGQGLAALEAADIVVDGPLMESKAKEINLGFISRMERKRPWVR